MAAVLGLDDAQVESLCDGIDGVWVANYNCPGQIVVSGEDAAVDALIEAAVAAGSRRALKLAVSGAFHSPLTAAAADDLRPALEAAAFAAPAIGFFSTVTCRRGHGDDPDRPARRAGAVHAGDPRPRRRRRDTLPRDGSGRGAHRPDPQDRS
jgi:malonyl CoA-acyl carrier protein transacylase